MDTYRLNLKFHSIQDTQQDYSLNIYLATKETEQREAAYFCDVLLLADQSQPFQWTPGMTQGRMETLVTLLANGVGLNTDSDVWLTFLLLSFSITLHRESVSPIVKLVLNLLKRSLETHTILG